MDDAGNNDWFAYLPTKTFATGSADTVQYYISATSNNGKTITKPMTGADGAYTFTMSANAGIEAAVEEENDRFGQFYPNPATDKAEMVIDLGNGNNYEVTVFDISGRSVYNGSLKTNGKVVYSINAAMLETGMYTVVFTNSNERVVRKLMVK